MTDIMRLLVVCTDRGQHSRTRLGGLDLTRDDRVLFAGDAVRIKYGTHGGFAPTLPNSSQTKAGSGWRSTAPAATATSNGARRQPKT